MVEQKALLDLSTVASVVGLSCEGCKSATVFLVESIVFQDLLKMEESQKKQLTDLQTQHKHLTWKLENLM